MQALIQIQWLMLMGLAQVKQTQPSLLPIRDMEMAQHMLQEFVTNIQLQLAVLLITAIGVLPSTMTPPHGPSTSTMATSTTTPARTPHTMCVLFGYFNNLSI